MEMKMEMEMEVGGRGGGRGRRRRRGRRGEPVGEGLFVGVHSTLQHGRVQDSTFPHQSLRSRAGVSSPDLSLRYSVIYSFICSLIAVISQRQTRSGQSREVCLSDCVSCRALNIAERVAGELKETVEVWRRHGMAWHPYLPARDGGGGADVEVFG